MRYAFVISKLIAVEYTLLRDGLPTQLLESRYSDVGMSRTYFLELSAITGELFEFMAELKSEGREYRLMDLLDSPPDLPEVNLDNETHNL